MITFSVLLIIFIHWTNTYVCCGAGSSILVDKKHSCSQEAHSLVPSSFLKALPLLPPFLSAQATPLYKNPSFILTLSSSQSKNFLFSFFLNGCLYLRTWNTGPTPYRPCYRILSFYDQWLPSLPKSID